MGRPKLKLKEHKITQSLAKNLWTATAGHSLTRDMAIVVGGSLFVAACAQVTVPMWPVPMTLQTLAVLLVGGLAGAWLGVAALVLYAFEGALGLPFFAGGKSGLFDAKLSYLFPSGSMGYVIGFVLAAYAVGFLFRTSQKASAMHAIFASMLAAAVVYIPGLVWLAVWSSTTQGLSWNDAIYASLNWGLYPFILGDTLKAVISGLSLYGVNIWRRHG